MDAIIKQISLFLAKQLDKLKMSSPIIFLVVQGALITISSLISSDAVTIPTPEFILKLGLNLDAIFTALFVGLTALLSPRTTKIIKEGK